MKTLAAALSIAIAAGGAMGDATIASASMTHGATSKATWTSHAKLRQPSYAKLRAQFAELRQNAAKSANSQNRASTTRFISNVADSGSGSLREALATAVDGDIIDLRNMHGSLLLSSALQTNAQVEIRGPGRNVLTIDAGHADRAITSAHGLRMSNVTVVNGATPHASSNGGCLSVTGNVYLENVTFSGCTAGDASTPVAYGGAISVSGQLYLNNVTVSNSTVTGYVVAVGGGISVVGNTNDGYNVGIYNSTVTGNSAIVPENYYAYLADGGGIAVLGSTAATPVPSAAVIYASTISGNTSVVQSTYYGTYYPAAQGGGANFQASDATIVRSNVTGNSTNAYNYSFGSGISTGNPITVTDAKFSGNTGTSGFIAYGGGLFAFVGASVDHSSFQSNSITGYISVGGGVAAEGTTAISDSIVSGNTVTSTGAFATGGGVSRKYNSNVGVASLTVTNSTISGNSVDGGGTDIGGGIYEQQSLTVNNSTIAFNTSGVYGAGVTTNKTALITLNSTIISNNTASDTYASSADLFAYGGPITVAGDHNLVIASDSGVTMPADTLTADPKLLPLADNGGGTLTHALDPTSPAIDTGSNPLTLLFDQRGTPYARVVGAAADIGAFELDTDRIFANGFE